MTELVVVLIGGLLLAVLGGGWILRKRTGHALRRPSLQTVRTPAVSDEPDAPQDFGYKTAWVAVRTEDPELVLEALGDGETVRANWASGLEVAYTLEPRIFITPPIQGWVLIVGRHLWGDDTVTLSWLTIPSLLATRFDEVQYFGTYRVCEFHAWARYCRGTLVRSYAYIGERGETLDDQGPQSDEEVRLGFRFFDERSPESQSDDYWKRTDLDFPDEQDVMNLAERWSLSPLRLSTTAPSPSAGWLKNVHLQPPSSSR